MDMHVAIHVTQGFLRYSYVMLQSLFESDPTVRFHVHVFSGNIEEQHLTDIRTMAISFEAKIHLYHIQEKRIREVFHASLPNHPIAMHTAYFMFDLLPPEVDRIITLQSDMVVKGSFRSLYEMDFEDAYAISLNGECIWKVPGFGGKEYFFNTFGKLGANFYSEVNVLLNVAAIRRDFSFADIQRADARVVELFGRSNEEWAFALLFQGRVKYVSEKIYAFYCTTVNAGLYAGMDVLSMIERAVAIHYFTYKPWDSAYDVQHSYWWRIAMKSPYAEEFLQEARDAAQRAYICAMGELPMREMFLDEVAESVGFLRNKRILLTGHLPKIAILVQHLTDWNFIGIYHPILFQKGNRSLVGLPLLSAEVAKEEADVLLVVVRRCHFEEMANTIMETSSICTIPAYFWNGQKIT